MPLGREYLRSLDPRGEMEKVTALDLGGDGGFLSFYEAKDRLVATKLLEIRGSPAELRLTDVGQADPAGQFRWRVKNDIAYFERAKTAGWATISELIKIDRTNLAITLLGDTALGETDLLLGGNGYLGLTANNLSLFLKGGLLSGANYGPLIQLDGYSVGGLMSFFTALAGGAAGGLRLQIGIGNTAVAAWSNVTHTGLVASDGVMIGVSSTNNQIDDASNGAGSTTMYIGNQSILVSNGINFGPAAVTSITVVNGQVTAIS